MGNPIRKMHLKRFLEFLQLEFHSFSIISGYKVVESPYVTTLVLGSRPKQGLARLWTKREAQKSHRMLPGV